MLIGYEYGKDSKSANSYDNNTDCKQKAGYCFGIMVLKTFFFNWFFICSIKNT